MKIEFVQPTRNIPDKQQLPLLFRQGDFFMSEVLEVRGQTALLRNSQGILLTAKLLGDIGLIAGDHVETVVDEAGRGRYVLRLLDVSRGGDLAAGSPGEQAGNTAAQSTRAQTIHGMLAMMKKNAGLEPKMAEFMARNGVADTPENIDTLTKLIKGDVKAGQVLTQMQGEALRAGTAASNSLAAYGQADIIEVTAAMPEATVKVQSAAQTVENVVSQQPEAAANMVKAEGGQPSAPPPAALPLTQAALMQQSPAVQAGQAATAEQISASLLTADKPDATAQPKTGFPTQSSDAHSMSEVQPQLQAADNALPQAYEPALNHAVKGTAASSENAMGATVNLSPEHAADITVKNAAAVPDSPVLLQPLQSDVTDVLAEKILSLMVDLKDKKTLPKQLKKAVEELPFHIKELKLSLKHADNIDGNTLGRQAESLDKQMSLMSELKRFDCYQIPIMTQNREQTTAELYVFKQKRRRPDADPESFAVLLGLDTQHMGRVETMIKAAGRNVTLEFRLEAAELTQAFEQGARALEPMIVQAGFRLTDVSAKELAARTTVLNAEDAQPGGQRTDAGGLDVRI